MMRKYVVAYSAWLVSVLAMAWVAYTWYQYVEGVGQDWLKQALEDRATEDTEVTDN